MKKIFVGIFLIALISLTGCTELLFPSTVEEEPEVVEIQNEITELYEEISNGCVGVYATNNAGGTSVGSGVIYKEENGQTLEPIDNLTIDVPEHNVSTIMGAMGQRKGELQRRKWNVLCCN